MKQKIKISNGIESMQVPIAHDGEHESGTLLINGMHYHFERIPKEQFIEEYKVDSDPDYSPQSDSEGYCYIIAPFSE